MAAASSFARKGGNCQSVPVPSGYTLDYPYYILYYVVGNCQSIPVPSGYTLDYPYYILYYVVGNCQSVPVPYGYTLDYPYYMLYHGVGNCKSVPVPSGYTLDFPYYILYHVVGNCQSVPVPSGYTLDYPYYGSKARGRYLCDTITNQQPFDSCPIVNCNNQHLNISTPVSCSVKDLFNTSQAEYEGGVTCTVNGVTCQRWDSDYPHVPDYFRGRSDLGNRCQYESEHRPWCYTTDPELVWDYCPVEDLDCGSPPSMTGINTEWPFRGSYGLAWYQCATFTTDDPLTSCPVARCDGDLTWTPVNVSCSVKDCYNGTALTYEGRVSCTQTGFPCQRWDSDYPHSHEILAGRSDLENWCQIEDASRPWCFTTDPEVQWEYCTVPECP
ncbi:plasminogen-like [Argopecten irradians]|uniref:plasminogen-like n=1 Tax=Argopecten irradians TaxID=31199 RepID=UPI003710221A